jgi:hypothetical protein
MILDAGLWILDFKVIFLFPLKTGSLTSIPDESGFPLRSNEHPETSISMLQAVKLINAHKLIGLRRSFIRKHPPEKRPREFPSALYRKFCHRFWQYVQLPKGINHDPNPNTPTLSGNNIKIRIFKIQNKAGPAQ